MTETEWKDDSDIPDIDDRHGKGRKIAGNAEYVRDRIGGLTRAGVDEGQ